MSIVTKIFIVLLVVVSMLNAAATVVFVNKGQTSEEQRAVTATRLATALADLQTANNLLNQKTSAYNTANAMLGDTKDRANADAQKAQNDLALVQDALKKQQLLNQNLNANLQALNDQLTIALKSNDDANKANGLLRDTNAQTLQKLADDDAALAHERERADTYGRQVEYLTEVNKKLSEQNDAIVRALHDHGIDVPQGNQGAPVAANQINGTVRDSSVVNGITYLTISVGSADGVQNGMEFSVVGDQATSPQFLGILTIVRTDTNSSVGRLQGDNNMIAKVKQGDGVTTHIQ